MSRHFCGTILSYERLGAEQGAGANRRWPPHFRCRGSRRESAVAQLFSLGHKSYFAFCREVAWSSSV
jgi:hypothetical protein